MSESRLLDYLDHIQQAATDACSFVEGLAKEDFLETSHVDWLIRESRRKIRTWSCNAKP